jgi:hypothetical protein
VFLSHHEHDVCPAHVSGGDFDASSDFCPRQVHLDSITAVEDFLSRRNVPPIAVANEKEFPRP